MTTYCLKYRVNASGDEREQVFPSVLSRELFAIGYGAWITVLRSWLGTEAEPQAPSTSTAVETQESRA